MRGAGSVILCADRAGSGSGRLGFSPTDRNQPANPPFWRTCWVHGFAGSV